MTEVAVKSALLDAHRGFLPIHDPAKAFPESSHLSILDDLGRELPHMLLQEDFRSQIRKLDVPNWPENLDPVEQKAFLRLYYLRLGFIASAYVNQIIAPPATELPSNIAQPLLQACKLLGRPPILSYDGYALYNWYRLDPDAPVQLGNIDTIQNFVALYDEHWFILVHVEIEALAEDILNAIIGIGHQLEQSKDEDKSENLNQSLMTIARLIGKQEQVLRRIPEHMDSSIYYKSFRPYIRFFENVTYEGVDMATMNFRGETGAQSSIMPSLVALMKIPHQPSLLTDHLSEMRQYMPREHRLFIQWLEGLPNFKPQASTEAFNAVLQAMASFRRVHYGWADEYIHQHTDDPRGTGGTPYMEWLQQLINETLNYCK